MNYFQFLRAISPRAISVLSITLLTSQSVIAGSTPIGTIDFSIPGAAGATAVPSLSGTMLIVLSLLLFIVAYRVSKQSGAKSNKLFVSLLGVFALSSSISGFKTISDANAGFDAPDALTLVLSSATMGSAPITGPATNFYDNSFGVPATITSINIEPGFSCSSSPVGLKPADFSAPICETDNVIPDGAQCQLSCFSDLMEISDIRLKHSIKPLLKLDNDIQLYSFKYNEGNDETYVGVMAQDLLLDDRYKQSVKKMSNDYYGVNYQALGLKMLSLQEWQKSHDAIYSN